MPGLRQISKVLAIFALCLALSACKLIFQMSGGGELRYLGFFDDSLACDAGEECTIDTPTPTFNGIYVAVPHAGWELAGWRQDNGFICGPGRGSTAADPDTCLIDNTRFAGYPNVEALIADENLAINVSPIFVPSVAGNPVTDTIVIGDREWAQPADFVGLSWGGINTVCPGGVCGPGAILRGFDMAGWNLASVEDVNAMANHYLAGEYTMGPGPDEYNDAFSVVISMLPASPFGSGGPWRNTLVIFGGCAGCSTTSMTGLTVTQSTADSNRAHRGRFSWYFDFTGQTAGQITTSNTVAKDENDLEHGAFFYRDLH